MHSLTNLNAYGETSLELVDQRPARVVFDLIPPLYAQNDFRFINVSGDYKYYPEPGIEITEIINYDICEPFVRIIIQSPNNPEFIANSIIAWDYGFPSHLTLNQSSNVYTISGLKTINDWNLIKNFYWRLYGGYSTVPLWYLDVSINYYDQATNLMAAKSWVVADPRNYYTTKLISEFTLGNKLNRIRTAQKSLSVVSTVECEPGPEKQGKANIVSTSTMSIVADKVIVIKLQSNFTQIISGMKVRTLNANLSSQVTVYARPYDYDKAQANITATATLNCSANDNIFTVYTVNAPNNTFHWATVSGTNLVVEWGDGTSTYYARRNNEPIDHTYINPFGQTLERQVTIRGSLTSFNYSKVDTSFQSTLIEIKTLNQGLQYLTVSGQPEFIKITNRLPSSVTSLIFFGSDCDAFNDTNIISWQTGNVTELSGAFAGCLEFSQDLSGWDVHLIPTKPNNFGFNSPNFPTSNHPVWGTYGS